MSGPRMLDSGSGSDLPFLAPTLAPFVTLGVISLLIDGQIYPLVYAEARAVTSRAVAIP